MRTAVRAVGITATGGPEVIRVIDRDVRTAGSGEVRIAVRAAAVNPMDILRRERGVEGLEPPWVPGMDAAGVVESVGADVDRLAVGDSVMAAMSPRRPEGGGQAELVVVPAASVVPVPDGASFAEAATLPMNGLTALLGLGAGKTIAVSGGAGPLASRGRLALRVAGIYPPERAAEAQLAMEAGGLRGRAIIPF